MLKRSTCLKAGVIMLPLMFIGATSAQAQLQKPVCDLQSDTMTEACAFYLQGFVDAMQAMQPSAAGVNASGADSAQDSGFFAGLEARAMRTRLSSARDGGSTETAFCLPTEFNTRSLASVVDSLEQDSSQPFSEQLRSALVTQYPCE